MRVLYCTDLHGAKWKFERIFEITKSLNVEIVINGGDMLPHGTILAQNEFINGFLDNHFSKFNEEKINFLVMLANDDFSIFDSSFEKICNKYQYVISIAQSKFSIDKEFEFLGMNWVTDFPFALKDRARKDTKDFVFPKQFGKPLLSTLNGWNYIDDWISYSDSLPTIEDEINKLIKPNNMESAIYIIHTPPYNLGLDICSDGSSVGSKAIYNFLAENQPLISLHGHIHESPEMSGQWYGYINKTLCIQPGQSHFNQNTLHYSLIELDSMKFNRFIVRKAE